MIQRIARNILVASMAASIWVAAMLPATVPAEELIREVHCSWQESDQGTTAIYYVMEIEKRHGEIVDEKTHIDFIAENTYLLLIEYGFEYRLRVAGVDAQGHQGPWSPWSDPYAPEAGPGD